MKTFRSCAGLAVLLIGLGLQASAQRYTDTQSDGLIGPVRSISTREERTQVDWHQPNGPAVVIPAGCQECDYDIGGNRIRQGQFLNGEFRGNLTRIVRRSNRPSDREN